MNINMQLDGRTFSIQGREYIFKAYGGGYQHGAGTYKIWNGDKFEEGGTYSMGLSDTNLIELITKPAIASSRLFYRSGFLPEGLESECLILD